MAIKRLRIILLVVAIIGVVGVIIFLYHPQVPSHLTIKVAQGNRLYSGSLDNPCTMSFYLYMDAESSYGEPSLISRVKITDDSSLISLDNINLEYSGDSTIDNTRYYEYLLSGTWASNSDISLINADLIIDYSELDEVVLPMGNIYYEYHEMTSNPVRLTYFKGELVEGKLKAVELSLSEDCVIQKIEGGDCIEITAIDEVYQAGDKLTIPVTSLDDYGTNSLLLSLKVLYLNQVINLFYGKIVCGEGEVSEYGTSQVPYA